MDFYYFRMRWKEGGEADVLFEEMEPKDARMYSARICGLARYMEGEKARDLFLKATKEGFTLSTAAYNAIVTYAKYAVARDYEERWKKAREVLTAMSEAGVEPDLQTFNAALALLARAASFPGRTWKGLEGTAVSVFQEMAKLGIQHSAGSYKHLLGAFQRSPKHIFRGVLLSCLDR